MRKNTRFMVLLFALLVLVLATAASAQTVVEQPVTYTVDVFASGVPVTGTPASTATVPATSVVCNLAALVVGTAAPDNPVRARFDDTVNAGRQCEANIAALVQALVPAANYVATLTANGPTLSSARSAASNPFNRKVTTAPAAPKGVLVLP